MRPAANAAEHNKTRCMGSTWNNPPVRRSLAYAKTREDLAEQVIRGELPGDVAESVLCQTQFFGKQFEAIQSGLGRLQMRQAPFQGGEMPLPRQKNILGSR